MSRTNVVIGVVFVGLTFNVNRNSSNPQSPSSDFGLFLHNQLHALSASIRDWKEKLMCKQINSYFSNLFIPRIKKIVVHESIVESRLNNIVPAQLLRLWINQEKDLVHELVALGEMVPSPWQQRLLPLFERHFRPFSTNWTQVKPLLVIICSRYVNY